MYLYLFTVSTEDHRNVPRSRSRRPAERRRSRYYTIDHDRPCAIESSRGTVKRFRAACSYTYEPLLRIYHGSRHARGSGTEEKGPRGDELVSDGHLSFPSTFLVVLVACSAPFLLYLHTLSRAHAFVFLAFPVGAGFVSTIVRSAEANLLSRLRRIRIGDAILVARRC